MDGTNGSAGYEHVAAALCLHELDSQSEQASSFIPYHFQIVFFCGAGECISPEEIHSLPTVQIAELIGINLYCPGIAQFQQFLQSAKVDIVCRVDRLSRPEDAMGDGNSATQDRTVFNIINSK